MEKLSVDTAVGTYGNTKPLKDGTITSERLSLNHIEVLPVISIFRRMVRGLEFDVSEMALSTYLCARAHGKPITAIPVFVVRGFQHRAIVYNTRSGIKTPKDLEGRRVGVRGYTVTTGVWVRGFLQTTYGVDLDKVTWVRSADEHVAEYVAPSNVVMADGDGDLVRMLLSGEIDAAIGLPAVDSPDVIPLFPDAREAAIANYKATDVYPINHTVVVKDELLAANPWLAEELFSVFKASKETYLPSLSGGGQLDAPDQAMAQMQSVVGDDPLPFGVAANRKTLETFIQFTAEQNIIPQKVNVEDVFAAGTLDLT